MFPDGVFVGKPPWVIGNKIAGYRTEFACPEEGWEVPFDASTLYFFSIGGKWYVLAEDHTPGVGPGDFCNEWDTAEQAVEDILDFYFGDPARMNVKAAAMKHLINDSPKKDPR